MSIRPLALIACLAAASLPVASAADEVWTMPDGQVVYEYDRGMDAVFSFPLDGATALLVIPGLAGQYPDRGQHEAYWVMPDADGCAAQVMTPVGHPSGWFGQAMIVFDNPGFPTGFTLVIGRCFGPLDTSMRAEAPAY